MEGMPLHEPISTVKVAHALAGMLLHVPISAMGVALALPGMALHVPMHLSPTEVGAGHGNQSPALEHAHSGTGTPSVAFLQSP